MTPIDLYFWPTPNGRKITIMLEECGLAYRVLPVNIGRGDQFKPQFLALSPNNRMPAILDPHGPQGQPISVFESGAILQYLGRKTGQFYPAEERRRVEVEQWLYWQMSGLGPMFGQAIHFRHHTPEPFEYSVDRYTKEAARLLQVLERRLADREFVATELSIADMAILPWALRAERVGFNLDTTPNILRWKTQLEARPAVARGLAVGVSDEHAYDTRDPAVRAILFGQR